MKRAIESHQRLGWANFVAMHEWSRAPRVEALGVEWEEARNGE